jgi:hypothetical protein
MVTIDSKPLHTQPSFADLARQEFVIMAKAFFAPIYGTWLVISELMKR